MNRYDYLDSNLGLAPKNHKTLAGVSLQGFHVCTPPRKRTCNQLRKIQLPIHVRKLVLGEKGKKRGLDLVGGITSLNIAIT
ncbi:MAG: hypothetical protein HOG49_35245 [Candidatus Scalindua sp.]|jgi:hypothetical protein|nr:hypothetical protein [Candidatus Scalindua sp.]